MGVERIPGPLGAWILGGLADFRPGVTSLMLCQTADLQTISGDSGSGPMPSEIETDEDKQEAAALDVAVGKPVTLNCWGPTDPKDGPPSVVHTTMVFDTPKKAAEAALKPLIATRKREEWGGLIYKVAGKKLYIAGPPVTEGDQAKVGLEFMGFGKGKWRRGDLPGLKTIATYHTHVRGDIDLGGGAISYHYEGIVPPSQIGYVLKMRDELAKAGADRNRIFEEALKVSTTVGGDVGVAINSHVDMYMMTIEGGFYHLDWQTLKETSLTRAKKATSPVRVEAPR